MIRRTDERVVLIGWNSDGITKVVSATLAVKTLAMENKINETVCIRELIKEIFGLPGRDMEINVIAYNMGILQAAVRDKSMMNPIKLLVKETNYAKLANLANTVKMVTM